MSIVGNPFAFSWVMVGYLQPMFFFYNLQFVRGVSTGILLVLGRRRSSLRWMSESMFVKMKIDLWYFFEEIGLVFIDII